MKERLKWYTVNACLFAGFLLLALGEHLAGEDGQS